jgi:hypothetical protein
MWRRWNERGSLGWFEWRTRASVYMLLAAVPVLAVVLAAGQPRVRVPGLAVFLLLSVVQAGVCIALLHAGLGRYLTAGPQPGSWLVASAAALTAACVLAAAAAFPAFTQPSGTAVPVSLLVAMIFGGALIVALTPLLSLRALLILVVVSAAATSTPNSPPTPSAPATARSPLAKLTSWNSRQAAPPSMKSPNARP